MANAPWRISDRRIQAALSKPCTEDETIRQLQGYSWRSIWQPALLAERRGNKGSIAILRALITLVIAEVQHKVLLGPFCQPELFVQDKINYAVTLLEAICTSQTIQPDDRTGWKDAVPTEAVTAALATQGALLDGIYGYLVELQKSNPDETSEEIKNRFIDLISEYPALLNAQLLQYFPDLVLVIVKALDTDWDIPLFSYANDPVIHDFLLMALRKHDGDSYVQAFFDGVCHSRILCRKAYTGNLTEMQQLVDLMKRLAFQLGKWNELDQFLKRHYGGLFAGQLAHIAAQNNHWALLAYCQKELGLSPLEPIAARFGTWITIAHRPEKMSKAMLLYLLTLERPAVPPLTGDPDDKEQPERALAVCIQAGDILKAPSSRGVTPLETILKEYPSEKSIPLATWYLEQGVDATCLDEDTIDTLFKKVLCASKPDYNYQSLEYRFFLYRLNASLQSKGWKPELPINFAKKEIDLLPIAESGYLPAVLELFKIAPTHPKKKKCEEIAIHGFIQYCSHPPVPLPDTVGDFLQCIKIIEFLIDDISNPRQMSAQIDRSIWRFFRSDFVIAQDVAKGLTQVEAFLFNIPTTNLTQTMKLQIHLLRIDWLGVMGGAQHDRICIQLAGIFQLLPVLSVTTEMEKAISQCLLHWLAKDIVPVLGLGPEDRSADSYLALTTQMRFWPCEKFTDARQAPEIRAKRLLIRMMLVDPVPDADPNRIKALDEVDEKASEVLDYKAIAAQLLPQLTDKALQQAVQNGLRGKEIKPSLQSTLVFRK